MNRQKRTAVLFALLALCVLHIADAQTIKETLGVGKKREYSGFFDSYYYRGPLAITGGAGISMYMGDLSSGYGAPGLAFSLGANYKFWPRTVFGIEYQHAAIAGTKTITASDSAATKTTVAFKGADWGINFYGRYYLIEDIIRKSPDRRTNKKVKPYITAGVGLLHYKATGSYSGAGLTAMFPAGLGIECKISQRLQIIPEFTHTFTFNDRLDGAPLSGGKDGFSTLMLKVQYAPFAPKKKKKITSAPADPNQHREEHQEWRKKKEKPAPVEEPLPGDENPEEDPKEEGTEENPDGEQPTEETPTEEQPTETK